MLTLSEAWSLALERGFGHHGGLIICVCVCVVGWNEVWVTTGAWLRIPKFSVDNLLPCIFFLTTILVILCPSDILCFSYTGEWWPAGDDNVT